MSVKLLEVEFKLASLLPSYNLYLAAGADLYI